MSGMIFSRLRPMAHRMTSPVLRNSQKFNSMVHSPLLASPLQKQSPFAAWNATARFYATMKKQKTAPLDQRPGEEIDLANPPAVQKIKKTFTMGKIFAAGCICGLLQHYLRSCEGPRGRNI